jgi:hypothetical protein
MEEPKQEAQPTIGEYQNWSLNGYLRGLGKMNLIIKYRGFV